MYWLRRPPYARWVAAGLILAVGLFLDTRPTPTSMHPYVAEPVGIGERVDDHVDWRSIPRDVLPEWVGSATGIAAKDLQSGTPLMRELIAEVPVPTGWWAVPLELAYPVAPGTPIRVTLEGRVVEGLVIGAIDTTGYGFTAPVAFPAEDAAAVARAATSALVVMVGSGESAAATGG